ncbi:MAG: DAK2 domain-containing protein [Spirochaetales bacterium]|nr:DAK2 domain-containing protein [Spirochaetales bacterium]
MITKQQIIEIFENAAREIINAKDELTAIDAKFGDADHGITMEKIGNAIISALNKHKNDAFSGIKTLFEDCADEIMKINGGSAVPLWNTFFEGFKNGVTDTQEVSVEDFKKMFQSALNEMGGITKARVGDKTMMDALIPAVEAITASTASDLAGITKEGANAAKKGAQDSADMVSKFGRAKSYKEQTIGTPDAGAMSVMYFFTGLSG